MHTSSRPSVMCSPYLYCMACIGSLDSPVAPKSDCGACEAVLWSWWSALACYSLVSVSYLSFHASPVLICLFPHLADPLTYILIRILPKRRRAYPMAILRVSAGEK